MKMVEWRPYVMKTLCSWLLVALFAFGACGSDRDPNPSASAPTAVAAAQQDSSPLASYVLSLDAAKRAGIHAAWVGEKGFSAVGLNFDVLTAEYPTIVNGVAVDAVRVTYAASKEPGVSIQLFTMKPDAWGRVRDRLPRAGANGVTVTRERIYSVDRDVIDAPSTVDKAHELWVAIDMREGNDAAGARILGLQDRIVVVDAPGILADGREVMTPARIEGLVRTQLHGYGSPLAAAAPPARDIASAVEKARVAGITTYWVGPQVEAGGFFTDTLEPNYEKGRAVDPGDTITLDYTSLIELRIDFRILSAPLASRDSVEAIWNRRSGDPREVEAVSIAGRAATLVRTYYPGTGQLRKLHSLTVLVAMDDAFVVAFANGLIGSGNVEDNVLISAPESFLKIAQTLRPYPE